MKILTIIICTYNRLELLLGCVQELARQVEEIGDADIEVVIIDNNSTDGTNLTVRNRNGQYRWLKLVEEAKQGLSHARNCGAKVAKGEYLCYLDDDARPSPDYLKNMLRIADEHQPDIFGGPILPFYTTPKPFWFQDALEIRRHADRSGFVDCPVSGGNFNIRAELLRELGGFSPEFGIVGSTLRLGEERELLERYRSTRSPEQRRIYYSQDCFIYHHVPAHKMTLRYFTYRAFLSGKMMVAIKDQNGLNHELVVARKASTNLSGKLRYLLFGSKGVYFPLRIIHQVSLMVGMLSQYFSNVRCLKS